MMDAATRRKILAGAIEDWSRDAMRDAEAVVLAMETLSGRRAAAQQAFDRELRDIERLYRELCGQCRHAATTIHVGACRRTTYQVCDVCRANL